MPIVINSRSCSNAGFWEKHLQKVESNERVEIIGFYGLSAETVKDAFSEMRAMAQASNNCKNYFSQYNINPRADEHLTEAQWEEAHALHLKNHGLDHLPYFRVRHIKDGREHEHGIVLRVDPETGKAISDSLTAAINERTSRALEIRFDLERGTSVLTANREQERPDRRPKKHENFRADRSGIDPETVKADARAARQRADNGQSFRAALEESGDYVLARGDRRDFVIIDRGGGDHSLGRRLGMKAAELRAFMADLDPASLPSVTEAKAQQQAREAAPGLLDNIQPDFEESYSNPSDRGGRPRQPESEDMDDDIIVKQRQQRQEIEDRQAAHYNDMVAERNRADRFIQDWQRDHEHGERNRRHLQEMVWRGGVEHDITDVRLRAMLAAGESRDFVQAVRHEGAMIAKEHAELQRQIALEKDPDKKHLLELKRDIQHADYMALANERVAAMSNLNSEQYKEALRQQEVWTNIATDLRKERLELQERKFAQEVNEDVERRMNAANANKVNAADRQQAAFRADIRGNQPGAQAAQTQEAAAAQGWRPVERDEVLQPGAHVRMNVQTGQTEIRTEPRGSDPQPLAEPTDTRQIESTTADHPEITDPKAAKKAALARHREEIERGVSRENTDARQSTAADHAEITDSKAAKKAGLARHREEVEQGIAQGRGRGYGNSR